MAKVKPDKRKYDVGDKVDVVLKNGNKLKGKVTAVRYKEPVHDDQGKYNSGIALNPDPDNRFDFEYLLDSGIVLKDEYLND